MAESKITKSEYRKLLWSNPHPGYWGTDNIVLSSSDYSELEVVFTTTNDSDATRLHIKYSKGRDIRLLFCNVEDLAANTFIMSRHLNWINNTTYAPALGQIARWGGQPESGVNYFVIPVEIYGIKY